MELCWISGLIIVKPSNPFYSGFIYRLYNILLSSFYGGSIVSYYCLELSNLNVSILCLNTPLTIWLGSKNRLYWIHMLSNMNNKQNQSGSDPTCFKKGFEKETNGWSWKFWENFIFFFRQTLNPVLNDISLGVTQLWQSATYLYLADFSLYQIE